MSHQRAKAIRKMLRKKGIDFKNNQSYSLEPGKPVFASPGRQDYQKLKRGIKKDGNK